VTHRSAALKLRGLAQKFADLATDAVGFAKPARPIVLLELR
jgi:hypothetical protein